MVERANHTQNMNMGVVPHEDVYAKQSPSTAFKKYTAVSLHKMKQEHAMLFKMVEIQFWSCILASVAATIGFLPDRIKVSLQLNTTPRFWVIWKDVLCGGFSQITAGFGVSLVRENTKAMYRASLKTYFPKKIDELVSGHPYEFWLGIIGKTLFGSFIDSTLMTPFEVMKIHRMANPEMRMWAILTFLYAQSGFKGPFKGWLLTFIKSNASWGYFFSSHKLSLKFFKKQDVMSHREIFLSAFVTGTLKAIFTTPIDVIKTRMQGPHHLDKGFWSIASQTVQEGGKTALMRGVGCRCIHAVLGQWGGFALANIFNQEKPPSSH